MLNCDIVTYVYNLDILIYLDIFFQFHYMYFATLLFWVTGIVAVIVSLATAPGEDYMVIKCYKS